MKKFKIKRLAFLLLLIVTSMAFSVSIISYNMIGIVSGVIGIIFTSIVIMIDV